MSDNPLEHFKANANPTFDKARKGFDPDQVNAYVKLAIAAVAAAENTVEEPASGSDTTVHLDGENEDLTQILTMARAAAARAITEAEAEAEALKQAARAEADQIVADAKAEALELQQMILNLKAGHSRAVEILDGHIDDTKAKIATVLDTLTAEVERLSIDPTPDTSDIDELLEGVEDEGSVEVDENQTETMDESVVSDDKSEEGEENEDPALDDKFKEFWESPRDEGDDKWLLDETPSK